MQSSVSGGRNHIDLFSQNSSIFGIRLRCRTKSTSSSNLKMKASRLLQQRALHLKGQSLRRRARNLLRSSVLYDLRTNISRGRWICPRITFRLESETVREYYVILWTLFITRYSFFPVPVFVLYLCLYSLLKRKFQDAQKL